MQKCAQALQRVGEAADPGASHNCWAYRVAQEVRSSDDGEPGGTAGRPILAAIEGEGLNGVCVLVTRSASNPPRALALHMFRLV